jgi:hypothetical protein
MKQGIKEKDIRDFEKYANKLSDVLQRIREYKPTACAYLAEDVLNLMSDEHHSFYGIDNQEYVVTYVYMPDFDGGDW